MAVGLRESAKWRLEKGGGNREFFSWELGSYLEPIGLLFHMGQKEPTGKRREDPLNLIVNVVSKLKRERDKGTPAVDGQNLQSDIKRLGIENELPEIIRRN